MSKKWTYTFLPTILIALFPKCHFCLLAYSSAAITLCSGKTVMGETSYLGIYAVVGLSLIVILSIGLNWRDERSYYAIGLSVIGLCLMLLSGFELANTIIYYLGAALLFISAWLNGSLLYFIRKFIPRLRSG